jgi:hypothetical protein
MGSTILDNCLVCRRGNAANLLSVPSCRDNQVVIDRCRDTADRSVMGFPECREYPRAKSRGVRDIIIAADANVRAVRDITAALGLL